MGRRRGRETIKLPKGSTRWIRAMRIAGSTNLFISLIRAIEIGQRRVGMACPPEVTFTYTDCPMAIAGWERHIV